jgi:hypothetical protein
MLLTFKLLDGVVDYNTFNEVDSLQIVRGNAYSLYFRLEQEFPCKSQNRRYVPLSGATMTVTFRNLEKKLEIIERIPTQPFSQDGSIWMVSILPTDKIAFSAMEVVLTEGTNVRRVIARSKLQVLEHGDHTQFC